MKVVIDTNVFVSGLINAFGPPGRVVDEAYSGSLTLLYDDRMFAEYAEVFHRPELPINAEHADALLAFVESEGEYVSGIPTDIVLPDVSDLCFLEVAIAGRANALVTGNVRHFKPVRGNHDVPVVAPADFVRRMTQ